MAYSKAKLKSNGDRASPCFKPFLIGNMSDKFLPIYCLYSQRMWVEVPSFTAHLLHNGLSSSPSRWRCFLRVLCPLRRTVRALDWVLLKDKSFALVPGLGHEISSRACLWVPSRPCHLAQCWLINQRLSLFLWKARIEAGSDQHHGLVKITPSCVIII